MIRCSRTAAPELLVANQDRWTAAYLERVDAGTGKLNWPQTGGIPLNRHLLRALREMTDSHCAYCDWFPLEAGGRETIDHFKPRRHYPELVFAWDNLFYACDGCQAEKHDQYDDQLLKPDDVDYDFERYFVVDFGSGRLEPNPAAAAPDQGRALKTIELLGLNRRERPAARLRFLRRLLSSTLHETVEIREEPYRYLATAVDDLSP